MVAWPEGAPIVLPVSAPGNAEQVLEAGEHGIPSQSLSQSLPIDEWMPKMYRGLPGNTRARSADPGANHDNDDVSTAYGDADGPEPDFDHDHDDDAVWVLPAVAGTAREWAHAANVMRVLCKGAGQL